VRFRWFVVGVLTLLLAPALTLTACRLLTPSAGPLVRLTSFVPYGLALYVVAFVILLIAALASKSTAARWFLLLSMAGIVLQGWWLAPSYLGEKTPATGPTIRVMTANLLLGDADPNRVVTLAVHDNVNLLVLEEVTPEELSRMDAAGLGDAFPNRAGTPVDGANGTMVFSTGPISQVQLLATGYASYSMDVQLAGNDVHLLAVHLRPPIGDASLWRADHAVLAAQATPAANAATLVVGDFNSTMDHRPMRDLVARGYADAATAARSGLQPTWPSSGEVSWVGVHVPSMVALDHVLVHRAAVRRTETVQIEGTDHRALLATLVL
jgi:endonuclease/exonuclease/phosphatase family metal-dependent hydrolase